MQDVCEESGLSYGAIYHYFSSKEELLHAIFERTSQMGREMVERARAEASGPKSTLEAIGEATFAHFDEPTFEFVTRTDVEIWPEMLRNTALRERFRAGLRYWHEVVTELLTEAQQRGELRQDVDPRAAAALDMCVVEGLRRYRLIDPDIFEPERIRLLLSRLSQNESSDDAVKD